MSVNSDDIVWSDPPCRLLVRSKNQVDLYTVPERNTSNNGNANDDKTQKKVLLVKGATSLVRMTSDAAFVLLSGVGVIKCNLQSPSETTCDTISAKPFFESSTGVQMMDISPKGTYVLTWERYYQDKCPFNLKLWSASTGKLVGAFYQKSLKREAWPYLQFTHDEKYAFLLATNEVRVYETQSAFVDNCNSNNDNDPSNVRYFDKCRIPGISTLSLPTIANDSHLVYWFTSFVPGDKNKPARASFHEYQKNALVGGGSSTTNSSNPYPSKLSKSLFQAEEMKTHWSPHGDAALITLQTSVDATGESYYGSSQLFLMTQFSTDITPISLDHISKSNAGPVLAVEWMPNPKKADACFVVVAGKMPAMASLHNGKTGQPTFLFGQAHRNTVAFAPHGRFVLLAGFGNLAGGMGFWDRNKMKLIPHLAENAQGTLRASNTTGYSWSPDSRLVCLSTAAPRMNVDNGIRLFRYTGEEITADNLPWDPKQFLPDQLLEATFVPAPALETYPDRPQSPPPARALEIADKASTAKPAATAAASTGGAAGGGGGRYVPPSARRAMAPGGRGLGAGGTSLAERMRKEREGTLVGATVVKKNQPTVAKSATGKVIPGLAVEAQTKSKSALKREKAKLKKQQEEVKKEQEVVTAPTEPQQQQQQQQPGSNDASAADPEKRARKIKKTLKQIDELKQKDPSSLNEDQKAKIESEGSLLAELKELRM